MTSPFLHIPVLSQELISGLQICPGGHYLDATLGRGGHTGLILEGFPDVRVTAIDRDQEAIAATQETLSHFGEDRLRFWQGNFADYSGQEAEFSGIIADLGVSSPQFDVPERGFSFRHEAPLDMRMDRQQSLTAQDIINYWSEKDLADLFYRYGEERRARPLARHLVQKRPFNTTTELDELSSLEKFLQKAPHWLQPGGHIAIISFHSLEDRIVKYAFRDSPELIIITKKPLISQPEEQAKNPRSRSAKLRIAERKAN
ncbi:16S rRNA (cytosine(1402)-N(4))-methyltransferase RsmH [Crocosphaera sp. UHCC 0190]|uniref:16S rRNA (cytosine(1402)-N(4))-methyltransferase RsmH n=1 Tax=Crocosphaera sp. UHCC 0190 TaxID=3110246 RepID=UPI002B1F9E7B|nr:16S rRNA (cytosine(1402)-N(4))-methyltransferase RsmH [Crocosphaera sp. UHCC 0190]MEA5511144.1 16S rRNA (cytosine(1402)-N(4))-methyltransferase RsmH [Crocosphaera sp. UHCC 0190]